MFNFGSDKNNNSETGENNTNNKHENNLEKALRNKIVINNIIIL